MGDQRGEQEQRKGGKKTMGMYYTSLLTFFRSPQILDLKKSSKLKYITYF